jgi:hypothetical protein
LQHRHRDLEITEEALECDQILVGQDTFLDVTMEEMRRLAVSKGEVDPRN